MSGIELGKAASAAGAWAWKCRLETRCEARFETPFIDFLKRRLEDAKSDGEKAQYLQPPWNEFDWGRVAASTGTWV